MFVTQSSNNPSTCGYTLYLPLSCLICKAFESQQVIIAGLRFRELACKVVMFNCDGVNKDEFISAG